MVGRWCDPSFRSCQLANDFELLCAGGIVFRFLTHSALLRCSLNKAVGCSRSCSVYLLNTSEPDVRFSLKPCTYSARIQQQIKENYSPQMWGTSVLGDIRHYCWCIKSIYSFTYQVTEINEDISHGHLFLFSCI